MLITRLYIKNYCVIEELDIELRPGVNGILGPNGSGKSSVLDALRFGITGKSIGDGRKTDNIRWGETQAKVIVVFQHGDSEYTIQRVIGRGGGQQLVAPDRTITSKEEIDNYLQQLLKTSIDALLDNVFVPQGSIESILFATNTPRQREIQKSLGLQRAAEAENALGREISRYNITIGLSEQLEATQASLHEAESEEEQLLSQREKLVSEIAELRPYQKRLHEVQELHSISASIRHANEVSTKAAEDLEESASTLKRVEHDRVVVEELVEALRPRAEAARKKQVEYEAGKRALSTREGLEAQLAETQAALDKSKSALGDDDPEELRKEVRELERKVDLRGRQLRDPACRPKLPQEEEAQKQLVELQRLHEYTKDHPDPPDELLQLEKDILHLEEDIRDFASGVCPRCAQSVENYDIEAERKRREEKIARADELEAAYTERRNKLLAEQVQEIKELQVKLDQFEQGALQALEASLTKLTGRLREQSQRAEKADLASRSLLRLSDQVTQLKNQLSSFDVDVYEDIDLVEVQKPIDDFDKASLKLGELTTEVNLRVKEVERASEALEAAEAARKELGEITSFPSDEEIEEAKRKVEILSARTQSLDELNSKIGTVEARLTQYRASVSRLEVQAAQEAQDNSWVALCKRVREVLHVSGLPYLMMQEYASILNRRIQFYLGIWEAPFRFYLSEDLDFLVDFPDGRHHSAARLSGGQKIVASTSYRLAMGDTFAKRVGLLILDEPSNYLDKDNIVHLQGLLLRLKELAGSTGRQSILVTHEECLMGFFDHTINVFN